VNYVAIFLDIPPSFEENIDGVLNSVNLGDIDASTLLHFEGQELFLREYIQIRVPDVKKTSVEWSLTVHAITVQLGP
jgi:hypothetical protein